MWKQFFKSKFADWDQPIGAGYGRPVDRGQSLEKQVVVMVVVQEVLADWICVFP